MAVTAPPLALIAARLEKLSFVRLSLLLTVNPSSSPRVHIADVVGEGGNRSEIHNHSPRAKTPREAVAVRCPAHQRGGAVDVHTGGSPPVFSVSPGALSVIVDVFSHAPHVQNT